MFFYAHTQELIVPWVAILRSTAVWSIVIGNFCSDWGAYTLLGLLPSYMKDVLQFDLQSNGFFSALPYLGFWVTIAFGGFIADFIRSRGWLSTQNTRKMMTSIGL